MDNRSYTATLLVDQTPTEVFRAINDVRGWWSRDIEGPTDRLGAEFKYHYRDIHRTVFKITEFVPDRKVVWHVLDNYFNFVKDKSEWIDTDIVFEIAGKDGKTELRFTHVGLSPAYECYDICSDAWGTYITGSLRDLITKGTGNPNPAEENDEDSHRKGEQDYTTSFVVDQSPDEVFAGINNVRGWWSGEFEGDTDRLGAEFTYRYEDVHYSVQKVTELIPGRKIVWHITDARLSFVEDIDEWKGTDIIFEIERTGGNTIVRFTHKGLVPAYECYKDCSNAWGTLIHSNLRNLITTGKNQPDPFAVHA